MKGNQIRAGCIKSFSVCRLCVLACDVFLVYDVYVFS